MLYEITELGYGITLYEDLNGYATVKMNGKVMKRYTNKREDAYGDAQRYAYDLFFEQQRRVN